MSEPTSFGNIVDSLRAVRRDYHEQLKSFAQYEAFLLIESSTEKAASALQGSTSSSIATDVIDSLQFARNRFEQHMTCIPEYRVLVAIDKLIKDVSADLGPQSDAHGSATDHAEPELGHTAVDEPEAPVETAEEEPEAPAEASPVAKLDNFAPPLVPAAFDVDESGVDDDIIQIHLPLEHVTEADEHDDLILSVKTET
jgi:hypothetical protein